MQEGEERQQEHGSHTLQSRQGCDAWFSGRCKRERNDNKNMVHTHCRVDRDVMHGLVEGAREREERQQEHGSHTLQSRQGCDAWFSGRCKRERGMTTRTWFTHIAE